MAPAPIACSAWVRSIDQYRRREELHGGILKFG
jgi:hypothetical protein